MQLVVVDWAFIIGFFVVALVVGVVVSKSAGKSETDFFLGGRSMPWWLLGFSMVATTFSTDTPNFVADVVRQQGVAGNWNWWAFLLTGMLTVFVYSRLWRRSGVTTDVEFYSIRYSGAAGRFLRVFRACYLGIAYNILIMAMVSVAAIKIGAVMLGLSPWETLGLAMLVTVIFTSLGGFRGVLLTDFLLFIMAMVGAFAAAYYALGHESVGGLEGMVEKFQTTEALKGKLDIFPSPSNTDLFVGVFVTCLAVQWWAAYYPGAEPGGGGYLVQRMLAAKDEKNALGATLFFNFAHYALRPWPWVLVALASMLVLPMDSKLEQEAAKKALAPKAVQAELVQLTKAEGAGSLTQPQTARLHELRKLQATTKGCSAIYAAFPDIPVDKVGHDVAYSAMIIKTVPAGWLGLIMASLIAAYMSTISTHLNWGSCYIVNDLLPRFKADASQKEKVWVGRVSTVVLMLITALVAMYIQNAKQAFDLLILVGAGTGLLFILRWFWWRINAWCEIVAMIVSFILAMTLNSEVVGKALGAFVGSGMVGPSKVVIGVLGTTMAWVVTAYVTKPTDTSVLRDFCRLIRPSGPGWKKVYAEAQAESVSLESTHVRESLPLGIILTVIGSVAVYTALFAAGYWIYGQTVTALISTAIALVSAGCVAVLWKKI